ncbi:unnamed protein product [Linum tenue]|uniref:SPARK domain-containing protein n=1 Tax=Linum tenue TaxID=586396 RepID=A0AAV0JD33_9ROSI|nr:unnamed protein product [Linum tenue]
MDEGVPLSRLTSTVVLLLLLLLLLSFEGCNSLEPLLPDLSPNAAPQPFLPILAPSPLTPFTNSTIPRLSGECALNFTAAESMMSVTSIDCWGFFAPLLANVMCCPQLEATLTILIGQASKASNMLALSGSASKYCLSDIEQILIGQGAAENLRRICSIHPSNLTKRSCPVSDVEEFEKSVESEKLLAACRNIDPVKECCEQVCHNAISEAAEKIAAKTSQVLTLNGPGTLPMNSSTVVHDCKNIVLRWLASKLDPSRAKEVLRGLTNCKVNKVCPLVFPDMKHVAKECSNTVRNQTECCQAMESYVSHLQKQSLITNLQALDCSTMLAMKLLKSNITSDIYSLCHITLKDFSLQVLGAESGCLLPSLPSDATFDQSSGISFICDLNDNIAAPWPTSSQLSASSCNKTIKIPALPAAASAQSGLYHRGVFFLVLLLTSTVTAVLS